MPIIIPVPPPAPPPITTTFEEAIYQVAAGDPQLAVMLAQVSDGGIPRPAIFEKLPPDDVNPLWVGPKFPRVTYEVTRRGDWTRTVTGTLVFTVLCATADSASPVDIADRLYTLFHGAAFHSTGEPVIFCQFQTSQIFDLGGSTIDHGDQILGISASYQLTGFPTLSSVVPSPIDALNAWSLATFPGAIQVDPAVYAPSNSIPAIYWRPASEVQEFPNRGTPDRFVTWYRCICRGTLLAPDTAARLQSSQLVSRALAHARELTLSDGSPFEFIRTSFDANADTTTGQVVVEGWVSNYFPDIEESDPLIEQYFLDLDTVPIG